MSISGSDNDVVFAYACFCSGTSVNHLCHQHTGVIRQNLDLARFRAETGLPLLQLSVQQAGPPSQGLLRQWPQPGSGAEKNIGYAFQWWAIAAVIAILYAWFQLVLPRRRQARGL